MLMNNTARDLKRIILEKIETRKKKKNELFELDQEITGLNEGYKALTGFSLTGQAKNKSVLDYAEEILRERYPKAMHVDELLKALEEKGINARKQSVSSGLIRFHNQQKRFVRVGKNTFTLLILKGK